jgi:hypothetical protein
MFWMARHKSFMRTFKIKTKERGHFFFYSKKPALIMSTENKIPSEEILAQKVNTHFNF